MTMTPKEILMRWQIKMSYDLHNRLHKLFLKKISLENCRPTNEDAMRASCSIVLTTDVYPTDVKDSSGFNTHTYTFEPSQVGKHFWQFIESEFDFRFAV